MSLAKDEFKWLFYISPAFPFCGMEFSVAPHRRENHQVFYPIIVSIVINMMDYLCCKKAPPHVLAHYVSMLREISLRGCLWMTGKIKESVSLSHYKGFNPTFAGTLITTIKTFGFVMFWNKHSIAHKAWSTNTGHPYLAFIGYRAMAATRDNVGQARSAYYNFFAYRTGNGYLGCSFGCA